MSIIEKALDKLDRGHLRRDPDAEEGAAPAAKAPPQAAETAPEQTGRETTAPAPAKQVKTSRQITLDLMALARTGVLTPNSVNSRLAEDYRRIKRPLLVNAFADGAAADNRNLILVTSSVAAEGKSYTSLNLAMSVATELDQTVLLIDGDVFKQSLTQRLALREEHGLSDYLTTDGADLADFLLRTNIPNLVFLPAGHLNHQIAELWASERMRKLVDELARRYPDRLVIFDSPPLLEQASTAVLASMVGQVLLVVEAEKTPQHVVTEALQGLGTQAKVNLVLNKSNQRFVSDYGYAYY